MLTEKAVPKPWIREKIVSVGDADGCLLSNNEKYIVSLTLNKFTYKKELNKKFIEHFRSSLILITFQRRVNQQTLQMPPKELEPHNLYHPRAW